MQEISDLDLPHLAMEEPWFAASPYAEFDAARQKHPWLARSNLGHVVTNYTAVRDLMAMEDRMRLPFSEMVEELGAKGSAWGDFQENHILSRNGPEHKRIRDVLAPSFTPRRANLHRPLMRDVISELLDEWAPKGEFDFEEFASWFPITVMCKLVGASPDAIPQLRSSLETLGLSVSMDPNIVDDLIRATELMNEFVDNLIREREETWASGDEHDLLDLLLEAKAAGSMTHADLANLLIFLLVAGYDTSKNILTLVMYEMVDRHDVYERCAKDVNYCARVIEESFRYHGSPNTSRILTHEITYRDVHMPVGTVLWFPWAVAARDPEVAEDAEEFRPEREQIKPHVGFALGGHMCLGQFIARAQLVEGLHLIAQRITKPRSPGPAGWRPFPGVWGIRGLPITFVPA